MKSIKNQYIDLKEGKMTQAQFMRNVRMSLPQYVTNITSFDDTVRILKNKAILTEADIYGIAGDPEAEAERKSAGMGIKPMQTPEDKYGVNKKIDQSELNFLKKIYAKTPTDKIKQMIDDLENRMNLGGMNEVKIQPLMIPQGNEYEGPSNQDIIPNFNVNRIHIEDESRDEDWPYAEYISGEIDGYNISYYPDDDFLIIHGKKGSLNESYTDPQSAYILDGIKGETKDNIKKVVGVDNSGHYSKDVNWFSENGYTKMTFDTVDELFAAVPNVGRVFSGGSIENQKSMAGIYKRHMGTNPFVVWIKKDSLNESYTTNTSGKELYSRFAEVDNLNGQEVLIGIDYELAKNNNLTKKEATKIVIKNLKKNQFYYTDTLMSGVEGYRAQYMNKFKPGSDQMRDVKSNDLVDKTNGMTSPKGIEKAKASSNKAKKETNKPETGIKLMSLVAKTVRGVKKMDATGEKMKKLALKENQEAYVDNLTQKIIDELESRGSYDSNEKIELIQRYQKKYNFSNEIAKKISDNIFMYNADERYDDGSELDEYSTMPGGDNMTDVAGHQMDEAKASSLSVGDKFKIAANLGKFVMDEEVEVISLEPFGNDIKLVLSNGKDEDDFYLDRNDEI